MVPLLPGYLAYATGMSAANISGTGRRGRAIAGTCPPGFKEARLDAEPEEDRFDVSCTMADGGQATQALEPDARQGIGAALAEVRQAMAERDGKGWRSCTVTLIAGGGFRMDVAD